MAIETIIKYKTIHSKSNKDENTKQIRFKIIQEKSVYLIYRILIKQLENKRQGTASCKTRSEVQGGGRKPWKQKGTGKARAGSIRSPLWRGGGVTFGPKYRNYTSKINTKEKKLAIRTLLYNKAPQIQIIPNDELYLDQPKTQLLVSKLENLKLDLKIKILVIVEQKDQNLYLSSRNLQNINLIQANQINSIALLEAKQILITSNSLKIIEKVYND